MNYLSPSLLAADFTRLGEQMRIIDQAGAQYFHYDVMDGQFVPNISMGLPVLQSIRKVTKKKLDVHLMIEHPERYISDFSDAGADIITVHAEADKHLDRLLQYIKSFGVKAGVSLNPATPENVLEYVLDKIDLVLVMTVNPGSGGQSFISSQLKKIERIKSMIGSRPVELEVDGGVNSETARLCRTAGADVLVAGSAVFGNGKYAENIRALKS